MENIFEEMATYARNLNEIEVKKLEDDLEAFVHQGNLLADFDPSDIDDDDQDIEEEENNSSIIITIIVIVLALITFGFIYQKTSLNLIMTDIAIIQLVSKLV